MGYTCVNGRTTLFLRSARGAGRETEEQNGGARSRERSLFSRMPGLHVYARENERESIRGKVVPRA